jgi:hypothetical protein
MLLTSVGCCIAILAIRVKALFDFDPLESLGFSDFPDFSLQTNDPFTPDELALADPLAVPLWGEEGHADWFTEATIDEELPMETSRLSQTQFDIWLLDDEPDLTSPSNDLVALDGCSWNSRIRRQENSMCLPSETQAPPEQPVDSDKLENTLDVVPLAPLFGPFYNQENDACAKYVGGLFPIAVCAEMSGSTSSTFRDLSDSDPFGSTCPSDYPREIPLLSEYNDVFDGTKLVNLKNCKLALPGPPYCYHPYSIYCCTTFCSVTPVGLFDTGTRASPCLLLSYLSFQFG